MSSFANLKFDANFRLSSSPQKMVNSPPEWILPKEHVERGDAFVLVVFPVRVRHRDLVRVGEERRGEIVDARRQFQKVVVVVFFAAAACASSSSFFAFGAKGFGGGGGGGGGVHHRRRPFVEANFFLPFFFFLSFFREGKKNDEIISQKKPIFFSLFFSFFLSRRGKKEWRNCSLKKTLRERSYIYILHTKMEKEAPKTGTTIVACEYADGVVVGADTRVSTGTFRCCCCCCVVSRDFLSRRRAPFYFTFFVQVRLLFCRDLIIIIIGLFTLSRNNNNNKNRDVHFQPRVG